MATATNDTTIDLTSPYCVLKRIADLRHRSTVLIDRQEAIEEEMRRIDAEHDELEPIAAVYLGRSAVEIEIHADITRTTYVLTADNSKVDIRERVFPSRIEPLSIDEIEAIRNPVDLSQDNPDDCNPLPIYRRINPDVPPVVVTDQEAS